MRVRVASMIVRCGRKTAWTSANASYSDAELPPQGGVLYYLVVPMGTDGHEGPKGWQGF